MSESRRWRDPVPLDHPPLPVTGNRIADEILTRRGFTSVDEARAWLNPDVLATCADAELDGLAFVVDRIGRAIIDGERIRIFGDYDCDGVTSSAILYGALKSALGDRGSIEVELPTREQGYGLRPEVLNGAIERGESLLIAVDCGSNDLGMIEGARARGLDVVVVDHHQLGIAIPEGAPVVNPQRGSSDDLRSMTAAGLAYLVVVCLAREGLDVAPTGKDERIYLDLAAIGTVGDVGSLCGVMNRAIVQAGVPVLQQTKRQGLRALARHGRFDLHAMTAEDISFRITPRLNAPGRVGDPRIAFELLIALDMDSADELANAVLAADQERKERSGQLIREVREALAGDEALTPVIVVHGETWASGLLGPVAAKIAEEHQRPAVVLGQSGEFLAGSGRSFGAWDMAEAFRQVDFLVRHGGHAKAAGLTVEKKLIADLRERLCELYERSEIEVAPEPEFIIEADIDADPVTLGLAEKIEAIGPFGAGNERPILRMRGVQITQWKPIGKDKAHAHVWLSRGGGSLRAVWFNGAERLRELDTSQRINVLVSLSINVWNQTRSVDARLIDLQLSV
jgi:single-stranded-DNA-specific exonuclease